MSRIHEALKKAELERNAVTALTDTLPPEQQTGFASKRENLVKSAEISLPPPADATARGVALRFEDIRENCAHVDWRPDPPEGCIRKYKAGTWGILGRLRGRNGCDSTWTGRWFVLRSPFAGSGILDQIGGDLPHTMDLYELYRVRTELY